MKYINSFFQKRKEVYLKDILKLLNIKNKTSFKNLLIGDIKSLDQAKKNDITFFHNSKYKFSINNTRSKIIITNKKLSNFISKSKILLIVDNVLVGVAKTTEFFYPNSLDEKFENILSVVERKKKYKNVKFGLNVLLGENVKIRKKFNGLL